MPIQVTTKISGVDETKRELAGWGRVRTERAKQALTDWAKLVQQEMQQDAPWQDRTGYARGNLYATASIHSKGGTVEVGGRAAYQLYLEFGHAGRFAIIMPTVRRLEGQLNQMLSAAISS
jgi:hypothetical protein